MASYKSETRQVGRKMVHLAKNKAMTKIAGRQAEVELLQQIADLFGKFSPSIKPKRKGFFASWMSFYTSISDSCLPEKPT
ncbi:MAG TPA: hypothetical protein PLI34_18710, partial [Saprospiraceae bacterium]|nr:hypothetical protein [Saprospiraceae bacterium]